MNAIFEWQYRKSKVPIDYSFAYLQIQMMRFAGKLVFQTGATAISIFREA